MWSFGFGVLPGGGRVGLLVDQPGSADGGDRERDQSFAGGGQQFAVDDQRVATFVTSRDANVIWPSIMLPVHWFYLRLLSAGQKPARTDARQ